MTRILSLLAFLISQSAFCGAIPAGVHKDRLKVFETQATKATLDQFIAALPLVGDCTEHELVMSTHEPDLHLYYMVAGALEKSGDTLSRGFTWYSSPNPDSYYGKPLSFIQNAHVDEALVSPLVTLKNGDLGYLDTNLSIDTTSVRVRYLAATKTWMVLYQHNIKDSDAILPNGKKDAYVCSFNQQPAPEPHL